MQTKPQTLSGWGNYPKILGEVFEPKDENDIIKFTKKNERSLLARGGGTSYGDASLNTGGVTINTSRLNKILNFDTKSGILHCQSGVTLHNIIKLFHLRGWFLSSTPGTKRATVGGCVACDSHGKNWKAGSFCNFVRGMNLLLHDGSIIYCDDKENSDLFHATIGGMGITGIILDVIFKLKKVNSSYLDVETIRFNSLEELFDLQNETMDSYEYLFSWLDSRKEGKSMGRGVLQRANHSKKDELIYKTKKVFQVPYYMPNFTINRYSVRAFNNAYYLSVGKTIKKKEMYITDFFYLLDCIADWNRLYGRSGVVEYQVVIPFDLAYGVIFEILKIITNSKLGSFLSAIKPLSDSRGLLSFPMDGISLAVDFANNPKLWQLLDKLDEIVIENGGRVYLAKDSRLSAAAFRCLYSNSLKKWESINRKYDTRNKFESMMFNRLYNS